MRISVFGVVCFLLVLGQAPGQGTKKKAGKPLAVSALELSTAYNTDTFKADAKYGGKMLIIDGKVHEVDTIVGTVWLQLAGYKAKDRKEPNTVICKMSAGIKAGMFKKGATAKVVGKCNGPVGVGQVDVIDCEIVKKGKGK